MDFIDWCDQVFRQIVDLSRTSPEVIRRQGWLSEFLLAEHLFGASVGNHAQYFGNERRQGLMDALDALKSCGLVGVKKSGQMIELISGRRGRDQPTDLTELWENVCSRSIDDEQAAILKIVNRHSVLVGG